MNSDFSGLDNDALTTRKLVDTAARYAPNEQTFVGLMVAAGLFAVATGINRGAAAMERAADALESLDEKLQVAIDRGLDEDSAAGEQA